MNKNKFKPLELTDSNVKELFEKCAQDEKDANSIIVSLYSKDNSARLYFDYSKKEDYKKTIKYLFGQLKIAHNNTQDITVSDLAMKYNGDSWVEDKATFMKFLFLGIATSQIFQISKNTGKTSNRGIKPTLSPEDPNFEAWYAEHKGEWEYEYNQIDGKNQIKLDIDDCGLSDAAVKNIVNNYGSLTDDQIDQLIDNMDKFTREQQDAIVGAARKKNRESIEKYL